MVDNRFDGCVTFAVVLSLVNQNGNSPRSCFCSSVSISQVYSDGLLRSVQRWQRLAKALMNQALQRRIFSIKDIKEPFHVEVVALGRCTQRKMLLVTADFQFVVAHIRSEEIVLDD